MLFDTSFLIHLERELKKGGVGTAHAFLQAHPDSPLNISIITLGEFAEGFPADQRQVCWDTLSHYNVLDLNRDIAWQAGQISRQLRQIGSGIGDNDIWIAATALHHRLPLVTGNTRHFQRIHGLLLASY